MKKIFLSLVIYAASAAYVVYHATGGSAAPSAPVAVTPPTSEPAPVPKPPPSPPASGGQRKGQYADGSYTGAAADAYYGLVQVKAVVTDGRVTDVIFLQHPSDRRTSQYINDQAMPLLTSEAIQAQSANVSGVSGASDTSAAFVQSLGDALSKAKA
jgi:uncharacterized protein with FMN-binding domain